MNVILDNKELPLEIMSTPSAISTGMMGREYLDGGMLFLFPEVSERSFLDERLFNTFRYNIHNQQ